MDFIEDHCVILTIILIIVIAICVIVSSIECEKSGGELVGGGKTPMYCVKKDAIISD